MSDILDSDVITEEIPTTGNPVSTGAAPVTQEFSFGAVKVNESPLSVVESANKSIVDDLTVVKSESSYSPPKLAVATSDIVSLDDLRAVSSMFDKGCVTFQDVVDGTGLDKSVVLACLTWLKNNGLAPLIAQSGKFYCTIDNVNSLQVQFKQCINCFSGKE
jgi:hypothetical protein